MRLSELPVGRSARVEQVEGQLPLARRLADLGFLPGTRITALRRAPLGDPVEFELRGCRLCLRRSEAECIRVRDEGSAE